MKMVSINKILCTISLICCVQDSSSYKILISILTPSNSFYNQAKALSDVLHARGHEITFLHGFSTKNLPYKEITIPEIFNEEYDVDFEEAGKEQTYMQKFRDLRIVPVLVEIFFKNAFSSEKLLNFMEDKNENFDLVIMDYFINEAYLGFAVKYDCPFIYLAGGPVYHNLAVLTGNPISPSTVPSVMLGFPLEMTFIQRFINTIMSACEAIIGIYFDKVNKEMYEQYFPNEAKMVEYSKLREKISLVLANTHPSMESARPFLPNVVEIAGFHIKDIEPLTKEYTDILDNAKNGVIFFSLGSYIKTHTLPQRLRESILKSLGKLKQTVLWKYEADLEGLPKNVIIKKWMPQTSILAHPNVKLFISHGGMLSTIEAVHAGKPVLAIPVAFDQFQNAEFLKRVNIAEVLTLNVLSESSLDAALDKVLNNTTYADSARKFRSTFIDRPMHPRDLAAFYVEHVIRTGGAKHLSAPHMNLFSSLLLDVLAVLVIPPFIILAASVCLCKRVCFSKNKSHSDNKEKKKTN